MRLERDKVRNSRFQVASECSNTAWLHWNTILSLSGHISVFKTIRYRNRSKLSEIIIVINYTVHFWYTSLFNMSSRTNRKACSTAWLSTEDIRCRVRGYFPSSRVEARGAFQSKFLPMCRISQIARSVPSNLVAVPSKILLIPQGEEKAGTLQIKSMNFRGSAKNSFHPLTG